MTTTIELAKQELGDLESLMGDVSNRFTAMSQQDDPDPKEFAMIKDQFERYEARAKELKGTIDARRFDPTEANLRKDHEAKSEVLRRWALGGMMALDEGERSEFINSENGRFQLGLRTEFPKPVIDDRGQPAMALPRITPRPAGPYPVDTRDSVIHNLEFYGSVRRAVFQFSTDDGNDLLLPSMDSTSKKGYRIPEVALRADPGRATQDDNPQFSQQRYYAQQYTSGPTAINKVAIQDSSVDLDLFIRRELERRIGRIQNDEFTLTASGDTPETKPEGLVTGARVALTSGTGAAGRRWDTSSNRVEDRLIDLIHSIDKTYREDMVEGDYGYTALGTGATGLMMSDSAYVSMIKAFKDEDRRSMLLSYDGGYSAGFRPFVMGWPIFINNAMAAPTNDVFATGDVICIFGNFEYYWIRNVNELEILRYDDSNYAEQNTVGFQAFTRTDGRYAGAFDGANGCEAVSAYKAAAS